MERWREVKKGLNFYCDLLSEIAEKLKTIRSLLNSHCPGKLQQDLHFLSCLPKLFHDCVACALLGKLGIRDCLLQLLSKVREEMVRVAEKAARHTTSFQSYQEVGRQCLRFDLNRVESIIGGGCGVLVLRIVVFRLRAILVIFAFFGLCARFVRSEPQTIITHR